MPAYNLMTHGRPAKVPMNKNIVDLHRSTGTLPLTLYCALCRAQLKKHKSVACHPKTVLNKHDICKVRNVVYVINKYVMLKQFCKNKQV